MEYMNALTAAEKWGVSVQTALRYCQDNSLPGVYKDGKNWKIPSDMKIHLKRDSQKYDGFTFIDLFCGVGGFHQAMRSLGGHCVFACDIKQQCREVYKANYCPNGEFPVEGDIIESINNNAIPRFDVLCGGFPCQTFSKAGLQNGFDVVENERGEKDERGQLFYRIIDILEKHPECKFIVLENVRNLADKRENWDIICKELKRLDFIITDEPIIASPHQFGIPQVRERVYILGVKRSCFDNRKSLPLGFLTYESLNIDSLKNPISEKDNCLSFVLDKKVSKKYLVPDEIEEILNIWDEFRANVKGLLSPFWIQKAGIGIYDRKKYLKDKTIGYSAMPEWKKKLVMKSRIMYENNYTFIDNWIKKYDMQSRILLHQKFEWNVGNDCSSIKDGIVQIRQSGIRVKRPNYFPSLVVMKNTPIVWDNSKNHYRYITPKEASRLQSFDDSFKFSKIDTVSYEQLGNSVNVELVRMFANELFKYGKGFKWMNRGGNGNE